MADVLIKVSVEGNAKVELDKISQSAKTASAEIEGGFSKASGAFDSFIGNLASNAVTGAFNILTNVAGKAFGAILDGVEAAQQTQNALTKLNQALANSGQFSKQASDDFVEFANSLQATTKFGDDAVLSTGALLASLTRLDNEGLKVATQASLDLATVLGIDAETAARRVAKAIEAGKDITKEYANITGAAQAQAKTFSGAIAILENAFSEVTKAFGEAIIKNKAVLASIQFINDELIKLNNGLGTATTTIDKFITNSLLKLSDAFLIIIKVVDVASRGITLLGTILASPTFALTRLISALIKLGSGDVRGAFQEIKTGFSTVIDNLDEIFLRQSRLDKFEKTIVDFAKAVRQAGPGRAEDITPTGGRAPDEAPNVPPLTDTDKENLLAKNEAIIQAEIDLAAQRKEINDLSEEDRKNAFLAAEAQIQSGRVVSEQFRNKLAIDAARKEEDDRKRRLAGERQLLEAKLSASNQFFGGLASLMRTNSKELFEIGRVAAIAQAIINTAQGVTRALATLGPFASLAIPGIIAAGAVQVATISSQRFKAQRGLTQVPPGFPGDSFPAALTSGERVVSAPQNQDLVRFLKGSEGLSNKLDTLIELTANQDRQIIVNVGSEELVNVLQSELDSGRVLAI